MNLFVDPGVVLSLITLVSGVTIYTFLKSRHVERMMQMELGTEFNKASRNYLEIKFGLLFVGIGLGILAAFILNQFYLPRTFEFYPAFIFLFGGLGLLISFYVVQSHQKEQEL